MRKIEKGKEPDTLTQYRASIPKEKLLDENIYNDFSKKSRDDCRNNQSGNLRKQLLEEQGYICCYCMSRIGCTNSKIEHFKDQSTHRDDQVNYQNLFVACMGNEGYPKDKQHCDTAKGNQDLIHINLLSDIEYQVRYLKGSGKIESSNPGIDWELNKILNLNATTLKENRKAAYHQFVVQLQKYLGSKKSWSREKIKKQIKKYKGRDSQNRSYQFNGMLLYLLKKKLQSLIK